MTDDAVFRCERTWRGDMPQEAHFPRLLSGSGPWEALEDLCRTLGLSARCEGEDVVHAFGALVRESRSAIEVRRGLVRLAWRLTAAERVILLLEEPTFHHLRLAASWPEPRLLRGGRRPDPGVSTLSLISTPEGAHVPRDQAPPLEGPRLRRSLSFHGLSLGSLLLYGDPELERCPRRRLRRLDTLCDLAASAERAWCAEGNVADLAPPVRDPLTGLHHASFLHAFLEHALALAKRRSEDLSLMLLAPDNLAEVRAEHGSEIADAVLQRVARAMAESLRVSDVVARLDRERLAAVLPSASARDALTVARQVVGIVAEAGLTAPTDPPMTASVGIAGFPQQGESREVLVTAATRALARANFIGKGTIITAED